MNLPYISPHLLLILTCPVSLSSQITHSKARGTVDYGIVPLSTLPNPSKELQKDYQYP